MLDLTRALAIVCGGWCCFVFGVQAIGIFQLVRNYSRPRARAACETRPEFRAQLPHVTIIRPVKGVETALYECLASSFRQTYPRSHLSVHLCVADRNDPALPTLERVVAAFPDVDARIFIEADDPVLHGPGGHARNLGPNPKIRNISRAYREAKGGDDPSAPAAVVWIVDCNVWVGPGVAGRMVDKLCGFRPDGTLAAPYKFVHQLPLVVDVTRPRPADGSSGGSGGGSGVAWSWSQMLASGGAALDEMFMATSHAKFYSAINTIGVAPCIVGKSNMFRKAHLDRVTDPAQNPTVLRHSDGTRGRGIDFFSSYICEDHLIGELLWRSPVPPLLGGDGVRRPVRNHGFVTGDPAVQPMQGVSVAAYASRRMRWLRVRKWTVLLATLVEPGIESLLWCAYMAFAWTVLGPGAGAASTITPRPAAAVATQFARCWATGVALWAIVDLCLFRFLLRCQSVAADPATPFFARGRRLPPRQEADAEANKDGGLPQRTLPEFLIAWLGREILALPIWMWAVLLGTTVTWRGKHFRVRMDMRVVALEPAEGKPEGSPRNGAANGTVLLETNAKARVD